MASSFLAPEVATGHRVEHGSDERAHSPSLVGKVGCVLRRCYERASSAIFDADGDCMGL